MAVAKLCHDTLMEKGREALFAAKRGLRTTAFEDVVEANTLLSGVGFENTGCSLAHGLQASFSTSKQASHMLHGELVAFGTLCQLVAENRPAEEFRTVFDFCLDTGLPVCLDDIGFPFGSEAEVLQCIEYGLSNRPIMHVEPFVVTKELLLNAVFYVDAYGQEKKVLSK
jgi:glycerol dehydrogenase